MAEYNNLLDQLSILQRQDLTSTEKFVAIVILSFRNAANGRCNPPVISKTQGKESICTRTGYSNVCVLKTINSLEKKNVFSIKKEVGQPSDFTFTGVNDVNTGINEVNTGVNVVNTRGGVNVVNRGINDVNKGCKPGLQGVLTTLIHNKEGTNNKQIINKEGGETFTLDTSSEPVKEKSRGSSFTLKTLPDDWKDAAEKLAPELDPEKLFEEFSDYWRAVPGERGRKKDWLATFRNHIRNLPDWKRKNFRKTNGYREPETREQDFSKIDYGESGLLSDFKF